MRINKLMKIIIIFLLLGICMFNSVYGAQSIIDMYDGNVSDADAGGGIAETRRLIGRYITIVQIFGVFVAVAMLMALGIKYMYASPGDKAQIKQHLTVYVIGAVVMFGASAILEIIKTFFINVSS